MSKEQTLSDTAAGLLASVDTVEVNAENIIDVIRDAEATIRAIPTSVDSVDAFKVIRHVYKPSKTLPTVEVVCEAAMSLAQVRGIQQSVEDGKEVTIVGLEPDADYALYLCQIVDKAVRVSWAEHAETETVKAMPNRVKSTYRRSFQRALCGTIRGHITAMTADRFIAMKAADRMVLAKKRDVVAGSALEVVA